MWAELEEQLPGLVDEGVDVWVQEELDAGPLGIAHENWTAFRFEAFYLRRDRIHLSASNEHSLAHELVHVRLGPDWDTLPVALEEGLCEAMAYRLVGDTGRWLQMLTAAAFGPESAEASGAPAELFDVEALWGPKTSRELQEHGHSHGVFLYGLSAVLVDRILRRGGIEQLYSLVQRARRENLKEVPMSWVLAAADVPSPHPAWQDLIAPEVDRALFKEFLARVREDETYRANVLEGIETVFQRVIGIPMLGITISRPLGELPGFQQWRRELGAGS